VKEREREYRRSGPGRLLPGGDERPARECVRGSAARRGRPGAAENSPPKKNRKTKRPSTTSANYLAERSQARVQDQS